MLALLSTGLVLAVNPIIATFGQIAALVICLFILIFVLLALVFNLAMGFGLKWVRDKSELIKMLRPSVESLNKTSEQSLQGIPPDTSGNPLVRTVSQLPVRMQAADKKVEQATDRVANAVIEFRARTVQAKTIVKAFLLPGTIQKRLTRREALEQGLEFKSPGYRMLMKEKAPEVPVEAETGDGYAQAVTASQLKDVPAR